MLNTIVVSLVLIGVAVVLYLSFRKKKHDGVFRGNLPNTLRGTTPKGATVYSYDKINPQILPLIDEGLDRAFTIASRDYGYTGFQLHPAYEVFIFPRSEKCINPAFLIYADGSPYDQTEWDKDPRPGKTMVCAAGMTIRAVVRARERLADREWSSRMISARW